MADLTCSEVRDRAPGFALDILDPATRADVAAHLLQCAGCAVEVSGMEASAAELLDLDGRRSGTGRTASDSRPLEAPRSDAPAAPPRRFDRRPFVTDTPQAAPGLVPWDPEQADPCDDDLRPATTPGRRRARVVLTMAAAAVMLVATAFGPEIVATAHRTPSATASVQLLAAGGVAGTASFYAGSKPVLVVDVHGLTVKGKLRCRVRSREGTVLDLGSFKLFAGGDAQWAVPDPLAPSDTQAVLLLDDHGQVVASASLS